MNLILERSNFAVFGDSFDLRRQLRARKPEREGGAHVRRKCTVGNFVVTLHNSRFYMNNEKKFR